MVHGVSNALTGGQREPPAAPCGPLGPRLHVGKEEGRFLENQEALKETKISPACDDRTA